MCKGSHRRENFLSEKYFRCKDAKIQKYKKANIYLYQNIFVHLHVQF